MPGTARTLRKMATFITNDGLHTGEQFAIRGPLNRLDICAVAYVVAEDCPPPAEFFTDEDASLRLIEASAPAMQAIRALSDALDSEPCVTEIAPGYEVPDYIEHVSNWAATPAPFADAPPTVSEVIGRILRAAQQHQGTRPGFTDAYGLCKTCGGHGSLMGDAIPYEELSNRRKQGADHGRKYYRSVTCTDCDGEDRATSAAEAQAESAA